MGLTSTQSPGVVSSLEALDPSWPVRLGAGAEGKKLYQKMSRGSHKAWQGRGPAVPAGVMEMAEGRDGCWESGNHQRMRLGSPAAATLLPLLIPPRARGPVLCRFHPRD